MKHTTREVEDVNNSTQIAALFDIGRLMVERGLPAIDMEVRADGTMRLEAYSYNGRGPRTWDELLATVEPWIAALGLRRDTISDAPRKLSDGWRRSLSAWGDFAGLTVTLHASVLVDAPVEAVAS